MSEAVLAEALPELLVVLEEDEERRGPCAECGDPGEELGTGSGIFVCPQCFDELRS